MKFIKIYFSSILISGLLFFSCADLHEDLIQAPSFNVHGDGALAPASQNFHGKLVINSSLESCKQCHARDFSGGVTNVSCSSANCHPSLVIHQSGITDPKSPAFHGKYFVPAVTKMAVCTQCHGNDYAGGKIGVACTTCHAPINVHQDGIINEASANFHGKFFAAANVKMESCKQCHGGALTGGDIGVSCASCHSAISVHQEGIVNTASQNFHGKFIASVNWSFTNCTTCHKTNYAGTSTSPSCLTCHNKPGGPEACNTCHGDFSDINKIAPPRSVSGSNAAVGAHTSHLYDNSLTSNVTCNQCHTVPNTMKDSGHIDNTPHAEVVFGSLAKFNNANPSFASGNYTCSNTYCHGNFKFAKASSQYPFVYTEDFIQGSNYSPKWSVVDGTQADCGTCHGIPPKGHQEADLRSCGTCHIGIVDNKGKIIDKTKHINGTVNVFGN